jgi:chemotaxis protein methyltransferase CheR
MIRLRPDEWKALAHYIASICGIQLDESKQYLIEGRLGTLVAEVGCRTYADLCDAARRDATRQIERRIIDAITTGETSFFRDRAPFELLRSVILPELVRTRTVQAGAGRVPIRIWSAACSTGQELYSIGMTLREVLGDAGRFDVRLLGTDISPQAIERASEARTASSRSSADSIPVRCRAI